MTPERLAKVAEVLRRHLPKDRYNDDGDTVGTYCTGCDWEGDYFADGEAGPFDDHLAAALAPLLDEFQAEDEARGAARMREAVEALAATWERVPNGYGPTHGPVFRQAAADLRAAVDAAEKAAVEGVAGAVSAEDRLSGHGGAGRGSEACGLSFGDGYTCDLPKGHE